MKMLGLTDDEIHAWLSGPNIARLGTINDDGSPRVTALWYLAEADGTISLKAQALSTERMPRWLSRNLCAG